MLTKLQGVLSTPTFGTTNTSILQELAMAVKQRVLIVIMDGVGVRNQQFGNAVACAYAPTLDFLKKNFLWTTLNAHGRHVGLPGTNDIGNSEVGHNTIGAGRCFEQGATLVNNAIECGEIYQSKAWNTAIKRSLSGGTLHFLGLLSDGNVHSHEKHLHSMLARAHGEGIKRIRVHALLDGRDVGEKTAHVYAARLEQQLLNMCKNGCDAQVASGGGRMSITMDRYEADWAMVERGWKIHVQGKAEVFASLSCAIEKLRQEHNCGDQFLPGFCVGKGGIPSGPIESGDSIIFFNFRGDRSLQISQAFDLPEFLHFERGPMEDIYFCGMMLYDGDLQIPKNYLVGPPRVDDTLGELLAESKIFQFACSETQKFGHVTYFWNGNRSGYIDKRWEEYLEIPSFGGPIEEKPWMRAAEITEACVARLREKSFDFGRINLANGDMVGHTGHWRATIKAVETVDLMLSRLLDACKASQTLLIVTADHGNCEEMFEGKASNFPDWQDYSRDPRPRPKTSHTLANVPFYLYDPLGSLGGKTLVAPGTGSLANIANTCLQLLGLPPCKHYEPSLLN